MMIVRIAGEGQFRVASAELERLNELDEVVVAAVASGDRQEYERQLARLLASVRECGEPLADDELLVSDVVLPPADTSLEEARQLFSGEGALPG